tara:strand:- start:283 stop:1098 length:816 start_codon:yes stop_codon:yes gene_type:complete
MNIGIIGAGNMATSLIKGFLTNKKNKIICSDIDSKKLSVFGKTKRVKTTLANIEVVKSSEFIFLCVKPQIVGKILHEIKGDLAFSKVLVSIAAGVKTKYLETHLEKTSKVIRTMPNLPCSVLKGVFAYKANKNCTSREIKKFIQIVETSGIPLALKKENDFDTVTSISGSGPAFLAEYISAQLEYAKSSGISSVLAKTLIFETIIGTVKYLNTTAIPAKKFVELVSSPGGTTESGVGVLKNKKFAKIVFNCFDAASKKSKKISNKISLKKD